MNEGTHGKIGANCNQLFTEIEVIRILSCTFYFSDNNRAYIKDSQVNLVGFVFFPDRTTDFVRGDAAGGNIQGFRGVLQNEKKKLIPI